MKERPPYRAYSGIGTVDLSYPQWGRSIHLIRIPTIHLKVLWTHAWSLSPLLSSLYQRAISFLPLFIFDRQYSEIRGIPMPSNS